LGKKNKKFEILKNRAKELSEELVENGVVGDQIEIIEFVLAYEKYGIESSFVREVYPMREFTPVPATPNFVMGIVNIRGQIISVVDIKKFFDLPERGLTDLNRLIITEYKDMEVGILADLILGVKNIAMSDIQSSLLTLTDIRSKYLKGVTKEGIVVLDVEKLLSDSKLIVDSEVVA
jgi:purine-binding chemotaxis protein CheW